MIFDIYQAVFIGEAIVHVEIRKAGLDDREILANLLEKYDYEFSQYDKRGVNKLGLFGYPYLDFYWTDDDRWAYLIYADNELAGFIMVFNYREERSRETDFQIAEFFVIYKYRRSGVGKQAFFQVLDKHRGRWGLGTHPENITAMTFWENSIDEYTKGQYEKCSSYPKAAYPDGSPVNLFYFDNSK